MHHIFMKGGDAYSQTETNDAGYEGTVWRYADRKSGDRDRWC